MRLIKFKHKLKTNLLNPFSFSAHFRARSGWPEYTENTESAKQSAEEDRQWPAAGNPRPAVHQRAGKQIGNADVLHIPANYGQFGQQHQRAARVRWVSTSSKLSHGALYSQKHTNFDRPSSGRGDVTKSWQVHKMENCQKSELVIITHTPRWPRLLRLVHMRYVLHAAASGQMSRRAINFYAPRLH